MANCSSGKSNSLRTSGDAIRKNVGGSGPNNGGSHLLSFFKTTTSVETFDMGLLVADTGFLIFGEAPVLCVPALPGDELNKAEPCLSLHLASIAVAGFGLLGESMDVTGVKRCEESVEDFSNSWRKRSFF